jgi:hypothetical protein
MRLYIIAAISLILMLILVFLIFAFFFSTGPGPVEIEVKADKPFYLQGEKITFSIYVNNKQNWRVLYPSNIAYSMSGVVTPSIFSDYAAGSIPSFPAHSTTLYDTFVWDQKMADRNLAQSGNYTLVVTLTGPVNYGNGGNCTIEIR